MNEGMTKNARTYRSKQRFRHDEKGTRRRVVYLKPWEVVRFPWGTAVRHRKGKWDVAFLSPDAYEIDLQYVDAELTNNGIFIRGRR